MNDHINPASKPEETNGLAGQTHSAALGAPITTAAQQYSGLAAPADASKDAPEPKQDGVNPRAIDELKFGMLAGVDRPGKYVGGSTMEVADMAPIPSPGRIVNYVITADQAREINNRRAHADAHRSVHKAAANGTMVHVGASVTEGRKFPMIITAVHGDEPTSLINGQVFLDGNDSLWVTSIAPGDQPGTYSWPQRL